MIGSPVFYGSTVYNVLKKMIDSTVFNVLKKKIGSTVFSVLKKMIGSPVFIKRWTDPVS